MAEVSAGRKLAFIAIDPSINGTGLAFMTYTGDFKNKHTFKLLSKYTLSLGRRKSIYLDKFLKKVDVVSLFKHAVDESERNFGSEYDFKWGVLENYSYASVGHLADLGEMAGLFKYCLYTYKQEPVNCHVIAPSSVKKKLTGSGKGDKLAVRSALRNYIEDYDAIIWNSLDESDACAVGVAHFLTMLEVHYNE